MHIVETNGSVGEILSVICLYLSLALFEEYHSNLSRIFFQRLRLYNEPKYDRFKTIIESRKNDLFRTDIENLEPYKLGSRQSTI